jgi:hypothetical protein
MISSKILFIGLIIIIAYVKVKLNSYSNLQNVLFIIFKRDRNQTPTVLTMPIMLRQQLSIQRKCNKYSNIKILNNYYLFVMNLLSCPQKCCFASTNLIAASIDSACCVNLEP